uniref:Uncharacterized protein n=1 Tax=Ixodes ricinus TaxID=34613 RepID=A0A6B0TSD3_IXORI
MAGLSLLSLQLGQERRVFLLHLLVVGGDPLEVGNHLLLALLLDLVFQVAHLPHDGARLFHRLEQLVGILVH